MNNQLKETEFVVEADTFAQHTLWEKWSAQSLIKHIWKDGSDSHFNTIKWEQLSPGYIETIGYIKKRPISIEIYWAKLNGHLIMFYNCCSLLADYKMVEDWLDKNCNPTYDNGARKARVDANNFGAVISWIKEQDNALNRA